MGTPIWWLLMRSANGRLFGQAREPLQALLGVGVDAASEEGDRGVEELRALEVGGELRALAEAGGVGVGGELAAPHPQLPERGEQQQRQTAEQQTGGRRPERGEAPRREQQARVTRPSSWAMTAASAGAQTSARWR